MVYESSGSNRAHFEHPLPFVSRCVAWVQGSGFGCKNPTIRGIDGCNQRSKLNAETEVTLLLQRDRMNLAFTMTGKYD